MSTAQDIINKAQYAYPDLPNDVGLSYLNDIMRSTYASWALRREDISIDLVAEQMAYSLPDRVNHIWSAEYFDSSSEVRTLGSGSYEEFERYRSQWRQQGAGTPNEFFVWPGASGFDVYLWPPPNTSTDVGTGYPKVVMYCTIAPDELTLSSTVPPVFVDDVYLKSFICMRWAQDRHHRDYPVRLQAFEMDRARQNAWLRKRNIREVPQLFPETGPRGTRVRVV